MELFKKNIGKIGIAVVAAIVYVWCATLGLGIIGENPGVIDLRFTVVACAAAFVWEYYLYSYVMWKRGAAFSKQEYILFSLSSVAFVLPWRELFLWISK